MNDLTECNEATGTESTAIVPSEAERHRRKCQVCRHPDREAIEKEYVEWGQPPVIAQHYNLPVRALYRHFDAVGLRSHRRANLRQVLERMLERGAEVPITGNTIIRAVEAYCSLTDDNKWTEPAKNVTLTAQNEPKLHQMKPIDQLNRPSTSGHSLIVGPDPLIDTEPIRN
ncbi:MAG TPA: hypothetical protein VIY69_09560 [Candidatus Acidoferrales bacterium]